MFILLVKIDYCLFFFESVDRFFYSFCWVRGEGIYGGFDKLILLVGYMIVFLYSCDILVGLGLFRFF